MHISATNGHLDIVQALLEAAGEHKRELLMLANKNGDTCMHMSAANGHLEVTDALRNASEQGGS
jgi:ankyrin repeat protein